MDAAGTKVVGEEKSSAQRVLAAGRQVDGEMRIAMCAYCDVPLL
jgi:hypothetical protein